MKTLDLKCPLSTDFQMKFSPDGRFLGICRTGYPYCQPFIIETVSEVEDPCIHLPTCHGMTFVSGRPELIIVDDDFSGHLALLTFDLETRDFVRRVPTHYTDTLLQNPRDGLLYCAQSGDEPRSGFIARYNPETLEMVDVVMLSMRSIFRMEFSVDGRFLLLASQKGIQMLQIDVSPAKIRRSWECQPSSFGLSPDARRVVVALKTHQEYRLRAGKLILRNIDSGKILWQSFSDRRRVTAVAYSPGAPIIASGDSRGHILFWDESGKVLQRYHWGMATIAAVTFAPDGLRCAAADIHGKVVIWDVDD